MIQVEHLTKRYGSHLAVDDISFEVEEGIVYGLLGPNGAGKSTTMNILTGYLSATSGTVSIDGHDILEEASAAKACVGYLPEQPPLYVDMTPREYLMFVAELKKVKRADRAAQVEQAIDRTGLAEMEHRLIKNLSKGYRQRVGLAAALLGSPKVIILDEPTVGLDPAQVIEIRSLIKELRKDHTVILSSHILSEVSTLCDKVLIIAKGKLVAQGTPEELAQRLTAGSSLNITALGEADAVMNAMLTVPGVSEVQITGQQNGETSATVQVPQGEDLRAAVSAALAAAGCPVLGLTTASMSLEDVFLQLTAQAGDEEAQEVLENQEEATLRPEDLDFVQNAVESGESGEKPWLEDSEQPDEEELRQENASAQAEEEEADEK